MPTEPVIRLDAGPSESETILQQQYVPQQGLSEFKRRWLPTDVAKMPIISGRVVGIHPEQLAVDIAPFAGGFLSNVPVVFPGTGGRTGEVYLPPVTEGDLTCAPTGKDDVYALAILADQRAGNWFAFLFPPEVNELSFEETGLRIRRHESDMYEVTDKEGNYDLVFSDGSRLKVGKSTDKRELAGKDHDGRWNPRAMEKKVLYFEHSSGAKLTIQTNGAISIETPGTFGVVSDGDMTFETKGNLAFKASRVDFAKG